MTMTVTQVLGAKVQPTFADPAEWNSTRTYTPLTVVLHKGNSFTSKQYVPVGIDITNTDFWAETGNYNAQVEQYRQEVLTFDKRITANTNSISAETTRATKAEKANADAIAEINAEKYLVALGDSFGKGESASPWWHSYLSEHFGLTDKNYCEGYDGYVTTNPNSGRNFLDRAKEAAADTTFDNDDVAMVVVYGGLNDRNQTDGTVISKAAVTLAQYLVDTFTKAKIYLAGPTSWYKWTVSNTLANTTGTWESFMAGVLSYAAKQFPNVCYLPVNCITGNSEYFVGTYDGAHFNETGSKAAGNAMIQAIETGRYVTNNLYGTDASVYDDSGNELASNISWKVKINNATTELWIGPIEVENPTSTLWLRLPNRFRIPSLTQYFNVAYRLSDYTSATFGPLGNGPSSTHMDDCMRIQFVNTEKKTYLLVHLVYTSFD